MITKNKRSGKISAKPNEKFNMDAFTKKYNLKKKIPKKFWIGFFVIILLVIGAIVTIVVISNLNASHDAPTNNTSSADNNEKPKEPKEKPSPEPEKTVSDDELSIQPITSISSSNPTIKYGRLMLINPNFMVDSNFIAARRTELISLSSTYGISELHSYNGDNLIEKEAGEKLNQMLADYTAAYPGHQIQTVSCFRSVGTSCGRLCMPTGASDHHTGLTCDLIDASYGDSLDTDTYDQHLDWQWLKANSYKYGFIDRFPLAWAGGSMAEPMNIDASGSTGLYETWHYRYVGVYAATQIATGVYNNGAYDSLEHYLLARGLVTNLVNGV